ncbi:uncharacterized protein LOC112553147 [Pomacea canaliculata]|uniref:uncharacterized protein LOC112553147 n=1 Tax=Pomacea canaliculata TaxID=400727 RepID=UPI000D7343FC|nr:uncharacterized protein LOC112553147 [Pomacea canaliculata]
MASVWTVLCLLGFAFVSAHASGCTDIFHGLGCRPLNASCRSGKAVLSRSLCPNPKEKCCVPSTVHKCLSGLACSGRPKGEVGSINGTPVCCPPNTRPGFMIFERMCFCKE